MPSIGQTTSSLTNSSGLSTDNALVRWDGVTGRIVQNSNAILVDAGQLSLSETSGTTSVLSLTSSSYIPGDPTAFAASEISATAITSAAGSEAIGQRIVFTDASGDDGYTIIGQRISVVGGGSSSDNVGLDVTVTGAGVPYAAKFNSGLVQVGSLTASRATVTDASKNLASSATTATEIGYVSGVTSAIQTQLNNKQPLDSTLTALAAYNTNGILTQTAADTFVGRTIIGTTNRLTVTNGDGVAANPTLDISTSYVGQATITTLGTISSGTWNGSVIGLTYGGTNKALTASAGGVVWTDSDSMEILAGTATAGLALVSGASATPSWFAPTAGSVLFAGTSGVLSQSNSDFFWDNTNKYLGIGTNAPSSQLEIKNASAPHINVIGTGSNTTAYVTLTGRRLSGDRSWQVGACIGSFNQGFAIKYATGSINAFEIGTDGSCFIPNDGTGLGIGSTSLSALTSGSPMLQVTTSNTSYAPELKLENTGSNTGALIRLLSKQGAATITTTLKNLSTGNFDFEIQTTNGFTAKGFDGLNSVSCQDDGNYFATTGGTHFFTGGNIQQTSYSVIDTRNSIGTTSTDGYVLENTTSASLGAQQISPRIRFAGSGWATAVGPSNTGVKYPTATTGQGDNAAPWTNPNNMNASDSVFAQSTSLSLADPIASDHVICTFATNLIPTTATVAGIVVEINRKASAASTMIDEWVGLTVGGVVVSSNKANIVTTYGTSAATITYGASNDVWEYGFSASEINGGTFGVYYGCQVTGAGAFCSVDFIRVTIYYTVGAASTTEWIQELLPVQGSSAPTQQLNFKSQIASGGYTTQASIKDSGLVDARVGFSINGTTVLSGSTLGSSITSSSLTSLGTVTTGTWSATTVAVNKGGTGQTSYTNGQLLIGNTTGNTLTKATLTGTSNQITVTNGGGSITLSTPQNIDTAATPQFARIGLGAAADGTQLLSIGATTKTQFGTTGLCVTYNGLTTTNQGLAALVASSNLTTQGAAITATTIYAVPSTGVGMYRVSWMATITRAATTSCTLGGTNGFQVKFTDQNDSVVKTSNPTGVGHMTSSVNATGTTVSGVAYAYCKASTNLQYLFDYTSSGVTSMQYDLSIRVEFLG